MRARTKGWPHTHAWFSLGRWGKLINVLALIYGGFMIINIALWNDTGLFGDFGTDGRASLEPVHQHVHQAVRSGARGHAGLAAASRR